MRYFYENSYIAIRIKTTLCSEWLITLLVAWVTEYHRARDYTKQFALHLVVNHFVAKNTVFYDKMTG